MDLYSWKGENNLNVAKVMRRYHLSSRDEYTAYNRICGMITKLSAKLKTLPPEDPFRIALTEQLLTKLKDIGMIDTDKSLQKADGVTVSAICRRRLPVIMVRLKMAETLKAAITWIEQGQVRVGPNGTLMGTMHRLRNAYQLLLFRKFVIHLLSISSRVSFCGCSVVTDPSFLVTKSMEDYVTWVDQSKIRRSVQKYNDKLDDFDLL